MAASDRDSVEPSIDISSLRPGSVWQFFYEIRDVTDLSPAEEQQEPWEATVGEDRVGMAVVDTMPSDSVLVSRLAVQKPYRKRGVGKAILEAIINEYDNIYCRVRDRNDAGEALVRSVGLEERDCRFRKLTRFESPRE